MANIYVKTLTADKRWRHGKLEQQAARLFCRVFGHAWMRWRWSWEQEEVTEMEMPEGWKPPHPVVLLWFRGCERPCGTNQMCNATFEQKDELPS